MPSPRPAAGTTLIVASTVSMDATIGTLCVAGPGDDPGRVYFRDLGGFAGVLTRQVGGWSPSERVDAAVRTIAETMEPPPRVVWCAFQSSPEQTRVRNGMGRNDAANGWEYPGYIRAWENRGPIALLGVVVHDYAGTAWAPVGPQLRRLGAFVRRILEHYQ